MAAVELLLDAERFEARLGEALAWSDRAELCVLAPHSDHGKVSMWAKLLVASAKLERVLCGKADAAEGWLLHRWHESGALRLVGSGERLLHPQVLRFRRGAEVRAFLTSTPLTRSAFERDCGSVFYVAGAQDAELVLAVDRVVEAWKSAAHTPTGTELDELTAATPAAGPSRRLEPGEAEGLQVVSGEEAIRDGLAALLRVPCPDSGRTELAIQPEGELDASLVPEEKALRLVLAEGEGAAGSAQGQSPGGEGLTLSVAFDGETGNALLCRSASGRVHLLWRGGPLATREKQKQTLWLQCRLPLATVPVGDGPPQRAAVVLSSGEELGPQLERLREEVARLREQLSPQRKRALGPSSDDFESLPQEQQLALLWGYLIGLGRLSLDEAVEICARGLREDGYVEYQRLRREGRLYARLAEGLREAAAEASDFDGADGEVRAIQPRLEDYGREDWLDCLVHALPDGEALDRASAHRLVFDYAREFWGLGAQRLRSGGKTEKALKSTINSAIRRGLLKRMGAANVQKVSATANAPQRTAPAASLEPAASTATPSAIPSASAAAGPAASSSTPQRPADAPPFATPLATPLVTPLATPGPSHPEPLDAARAASLPPDPLAQPLADLPLSSRATNWMDRRGLAALRDLVGWHPDAFAREPNVGRLTVKETRAVLEKALGREWEEAWADLPDPKVGAFAAAEPESHSSDSLAARWSAQLSQLPPERRELPLQRLELPARMKTFCQGSGLTKVAELLKRPYAELIAQPNLGRSSLEKTLDALRECLAELEQPATDDGLLEGWRRTLARLPSLQRLILTHRSGTHGRRETLESVGEILGLTRERVRQVEAQYLEDLRDRSHWLHTLQRRLSEAFAGGRALPLPLLVEEDRWWQGAGENLELLDYLITRLLPQPLHRVEVTVDGDTTPFLAQFDESHLQAAQKAMLEAAARVPTPASLSDYEPLVQQALAALDRSLGEALRARLESELTFDESDGSRVLGFGSRKGDRILAYLAGQPEPVPVRQVVAELGRSALPEEVLYFRRGVIGLEQHFPDFRSWLERLPLRCVEIMQELPEGRQWLVPELHQRLQEQGQVPQWLGHWHLASLLRRSGRVAYLGRLRVALLAAGAPPQRILLEDAALTVLEEAGTPLPFDEIARRVRLRTDAQDASLNLMLLSSPFLKLGGDQYGLVERDVPGGAGAIASASQAVVDELSGRGRGLTFHQANQLARAATGQPWSDELLASLLRNEPQLRLARSGHVGLASWDDVRAPKRSELIRQQVEKAGGRLGVDRLQALLLETYGRTLQRVELANDCARALVLLRGDELVLPAEEGDGEGAGGNESAAAPPTPSPLELAEEAEPALVQEPASAQAEGVATITPLRSAIRALAPKLRPSAAAGTDRARSASAIGQPAGSGENGAEASAADANDSGESAATSSTGAIGAEAIDAHPSGVVDATGQPAEAEQGRDNRQSAAAISAPAAPTPSAAAPTRQDPCPTELASPPALAPLPFVDITAPAPPALPPRQPHPSRTVLGLPACPSQSPAVDLTGVVAGLPAESREHFEALLADPLRPLGDVLAEARAHLGAIEEASRDNEFIDLPLARKLVERMERLAERVAGLSATTRRIAQAAILYFISNDDAEDDFDLGGLEDDEAVLGAVLAHLELE